ncbi:F0F1 ATP synthase subunit delta [Candidatus Blochmannia vicinus (nom. nud.)]|uniref:ATP synthase subunit delta n=1 Tax=Candidatus Blochmannia vicinus (nom. nud.) TaxID=251540 RepID=A0A9Q8TWG3_9ENTR|nr:F0F1 ATP synthase subunit delta [Candidatus Blochmannia vicinus]URJ28157.1 F0F1 ATP synthase subunit delta [Candidatus Blochmannia vicinus]
MPNEVVISHIYAVAIFNVAIAYKNVRKWESMLDLFSKISQHSLVRSLFFRYLESKKLSNIFIAICEDYQKKQIDIFGKNMIYIMAENNRLSLLPIVFKEFVNLCAIHEGMVEIEIISGYPLSCRQLNKISDAMAKRLSKKVNLVHKIDKAMLAGVMIRVGDTIIDGSIRGRILRLNHILQS